MLIFNRDISILKLIILRNKQILIQNFREVTLTWFMKVGDDQYDLYMRVDTNTRGHRQWFYFSIKNKLKHTIKLNIYRFKKAYSLFQRGMKPYVRSVKNQQQWKPAGFNVRYIRQKENNEYGVKKGSSYFYLSFQYKFQNDQDQVYFAAGIPYTYSFLQQRLLYINQKIQQKNQLKVQNILLTKSMCGLQLKMLKISHLQAFQKQKKRNIAINARTHSGQASSSWVLDGIFQYFINNTNNLEWMRTYNISFYILPMLNIDGVFVGNYRTGIVGQDFNRKFYSGRKQIFPQIYCLKKMISNAKKQGNLLMFMDLHGHSILKNSFIYGPSQPDFSTSLLKKLPFYLWHKSKYFKMSSCKFLTQKDKIQTARMYFQIKQNILSFTCENSLGLYGTNQQTSQMKKQDWQKFGFGIIEAIKSTVQTQKEVEVNSQCEKQDLRQTDTPPLKQKPKPLTAPKIFQPYKLKYKQKNQYSSIKAKNQNLNTKTFEQTKSKIFPKYEGKGQKEKITIFSSKTVEEQNSKDIKTRLSQIRNKFPSLTSKQMKNKQEISNQMILADNKGRGKSVGGIQKSRTQNMNKTTTIIKSKYGLQYGQKYKQQMNEIDSVQNKQLKSLHNQKIKSLHNQKKQFLESIYHKKQLKDLKIRQNSQCLDLGKNLIPPIESIRQKIQQKKNKTFIIHNSSYNHPTSMNSNSVNSVLNKNYQNNNTKNNKKYSCDISSQTQHNPFQDVQISVKDIRVQRAVTYDQSYLSSQINKLRQMKQTQRQYCEQDDKINPWDNQQTNSNPYILFDDNFSEKFNDSVNDQDSCSQDLNQQDKKYLFQYIRASQNIRRQKMLDNTSQQDSKQLQQRQKCQQKNSNNIFQQKKRIHGFRQISFKSVCYQQQQKQPVYDPTSKLANSYATNCKIRKNPHKFKQSLNIVKYKSFSRKIQPQQKEDQTQIYITHKKKLNQRSLRKQSRKDPFILVSIKQKCNGKFNAI